MKPEEFNPANQGEQPGSRAQSFFERMTLVQVMPKNLITGVVLIGLSLFIRSIIQEASVENTGAVYLAYDSSSGRALVGVLWVLAVVLLAVGVIRLFRAFTVKKS